MTALFRKTHRPAFRGLLKGFARSEDGSMLVFGLALFLLMLMIGGMSVDLMRYEQRRTLLQQTSDRAVLAAANLTQGLPPVAVVHDHYAKAGMVEFLTDVEVTDDRNSRIVRANAKEELKPFFMQMMGINKLDVPAASTAEQRISNVEIVMVLDVSGSMNWPTSGTTKIAALRAAAMEFVDAVKERDTQNLVTITIVPYNAQVNIPEALRAKYDITDLHGRDGVNCIEFPQAAFDTLTLSRAVEYPMYAFSDLTGPTIQNASYVAWDHPTRGLMNPNASFCREEPENVLRLPSDDANRIKSWINGLTAGGNTSITLGMKWAVALIDPVARPMMTELMGEGLIPAAHAGRPFDWNDPESMKVIIVMTDGDHVEHPRINEGFRTGPSPIWRSAGDGNYSIQHTANLPAAANGNEYYVPHLDAWQATPWDDGSGAAQQTWEQVWQSQRLKWVAWQLYARALGTDGASRDAAFTAAMNTFSSIWIPEDAMDANMLASCDQAKEQGVIIYGIAFEAPPQGQAVISNCASTPAYYFDAQGLEISSAFRSIASNISQLRLTQ